MKLSLLLLFAFPMTVYSAHGKNLPQLEKRVQEIPVGISCKGIHSMFLKIEGCNKKDFLRLLPNEYVGKIFQRIKDANKNQFLKKLNEEKIRYLVPLLDFKKIIMTFLGEQLNRVVTDKKLDKSITLYIRLCERAAKEDQDKISDEKWKREQKRKQNMVKPMMKKTSDSVAASGGGGGKVTRVATRSSAEKKALGSLSTRPRNRVLENKDEAGSKAMDSLSYASKERDFLEKSEENYIEFLSEICGDLQSLVEENNAVKLAKKITFLYKFLKKNAFIQILTTNFGLSEVTEDDFDALISEIHNHNIKRKIQDIKKQYLATRS